MPGWIFSSFSANSDQTFFWTSWSCNKVERLDESECQRRLPREVCMIHSLSNRAIIQKLPMGILPALGGIDSRPAAHLGRASEDGPHNFEYEEFETWPIADDFRHDPAGVGVVDDYFAFPGGGRGD